jgi:hypothetical protein
VPLHDSARPHFFDAGSCWQAPAPLQKPVLPQTPLGAQWGASATPLGTLAQVPAPLMLQDWQTPQLDVEQQTPSVQLPLAHWFAALQVALFAFFATQLPGVVASPVQ